MKRDGLLITVGRQGISRGIALKHLSHPQLNIQSAKDLTREETALQDVGLRGQTLKTIQMEGAWGSLHKLTS